MENKQNSFMFYDNFLEAIEQLPEAERANACYQLCKYALKDELPEDKSLAMFCIGVKYSVHKYQGRGGARIGAGRHKKNQDENQDEKLDFPLENGWGGKRAGAGRHKNAEIQEKKSSLENQKNQKNQNTQTETETETETKRESIERKDQKPVRGAFIPPTLEEVLEYAKDMNDHRGVGGFMCSRQTATDFFNHYDRQGWILGNGNHMTKWNPALRVWAAKEEKTLMER